MGKYILKRLVQIVVTLFIFQTLLFVILTAMPGDVTNRMFGNPDIPPEAIANAKKKLGLDDPVLVQYARWWRNFITGDLGVSFSEYPTPVIKIIQERVPRTLALFLTATLIQFTVGFTSGRILAWQRGGLVEYGSTLIGVLLFTVFTPWFGLMMIFIFGARLRWLPLGKFLEPRLWSSAVIPGLADSASKGNFVFNRMLLTASIFLVLWLAMLFSTRKLNSFQRRRILVGGTAGMIAIAAAVWAWSGIGNLAWDIIKHMILPVTTVTLVGYGGTMLLTRQTMLDTLREDYIQTARAKGVPETMVRNKHAARNALLPVLTNLIIGLPFTLSGGIITETVFSWPGMGRTLLNATNAEDVPLIMGVFSFIGILSLVAHLVADLTYAMLDPRIRYA
ncbi:MAG TPA: ABC transporter permease [Anaerolineae bacterium]|nr:ABC transporter permease [Anaerolineae bacterium]HQI86777.1 ABC transporter permease [Anaerolineae bacterium]